MANIKMKLGIIFCVSLVKMAASAPSGVHVGKHAAVGASSAGYSAGAGLDSGGKAYAEASAGSLGGASASFGRGGEPAIHGASGVHVRKESQPGLFDAIFNIPISTLGAVNQYLNNRRKVVAVKKYHSDDSAGIDGRIGADASAASAASASTGAVSLQKNYDGIFNIPISALKSVNQLLNG